MSAMGNALSSVRRRISSAPMRGRPGRRVRGARARSSGAGTGTMRGGPQPGGAGDGAHEVRVGHGVRPGDDQGVRAVPGPVHGGAEAAGHVGLVDGLHEGTAAAGQGDDGEAAEQGGEALHVVLPSGAVDHGGMQDDAGAGGGLQGGLAGLDAPAVGVGPACVSAGAAEEDEALGIGCGGEDGGDVAGMGAGDDEAGVGEGRGEGGVSEVGGDGGAGQAGGGPAGGAADDGDVGEAVAQQGAAEGGAGAAGGADDVGGHGAAVPASSLGPTSRSADAVAIQGRWAGGAALAVPGLPRRCAPRNDGSAPSLARAWLRGRPGNAPALHVKLDVVSCYHTEKP